jgi:hypothetical protein
VYLTGAKMKTVNLNDIRIDGGTQSRVVIDQALVYSYIECMKEGDVFPPIETVFDGVVHWLVDGFHRYHAYKLMGIKKTDVEYKPGTQEEAQVRSFGVNGRHGKQRTIEDKRNAVLAAFEHPLTKDGSDREIARICSVTHPFVAGMRNPEVKEKRAKEKKEKAAGNVSNPEPKTGNVSTPKTKSGNVSIDAPQTGNVSNQDVGPDEQELRANELAQQADLDMLNKLLESDEPLKLAHEEIKRLNLRVAQLETRLGSLMTEKNEAIKDAKRAQAQLDKIKKAKK